MLQNASTSGTIHQQECTCDRDELSHVAETGAFPEQDRTAGSSSSVEVYLSVMFCLLIGPGCFCSFKFQDIVGCDGTLGHPNKRKSKKVSEGSNNIHILNTI